MALAPLVIRWSPDTSGDMLRQCARCTCGAPGMPCPTCNTSDPPRPFPGLRVTVDNKGPRHRGNTAFRLQALNDRRRSLFDNELVPHSELAIATDVTRKKRVNCSLGALLGGQLHAPSVIVPDNHAARID